MPFPPFSFFSEFVRKEAKTRNDPSFLIGPHHSTSNKKELFSRSAHTRQTVSAQKTDVYTEVTSGVERYGADLNKHCPIHRKPHPLRKCKSFRNMLLEDRKKFVKENHICFRCLASTTHQAKDCDVPVKCLECESEKHLAALHPGPPPKLFKTFSTPTEHGGEEEAKPLSGVAAMCTQVCKNGFFGKSCSKICLVQVFHQNQKHNVKRMYAILDEQSNHSLAREQFFDMFGINGTAEP